MARNTSPTESPEAVGLKADDTRAVKSKPLLSRWLVSSGAWVLVLDLVLILAFGMLSTNNVFWTLQNAQNLMLGGTEALLLALGVAMLLGAGFFDLSLGANLVLSSVIGARTVTAIAGPGTDGTYHSVALALGCGLVACLLTGVIFGLVNGLFVAYVGVNSLIVTLATLGIGTGLALVLTNGSDIGGMPSAMQTGFGLAVIGGIPVPAFIAVVLAVLLWGVLRYTRYGLRTLAIGSARPSAERAGLNVKLHYVSLAVLAGALAGFAGFVDLSRFASTTINGHTQDGLAALTAVVIGGTLLEGGKVSIAGTVWGSVLAIVLQGGLVIIGVPTFYQVVAIGAVLLFAVSFDRARFIRRLRA